MSVVHVPCLTSAITHFFPIADFYMGETLWHSSLNKVYTKSCLCDKYASIAHSWTHIFSSPRCQLLCRHNKVVSFPITVWQSSSLVISYLRYCIIVNLHLNLVVSSCLIWPIRFDVTLWRQTWLVKLNGLLTLTAC